MIDLKNYICSLPFTNMELHHKENYMCCPSWLTKPLKGQVPLSELWNSEESNDIRKSIMDGSYKYCDKTQCPFLSKLISLGDTSGGPIFQKNTLPPYIIDNYDVNTGQMGTGPSIIQMSFDRTCNLKCPSCRVGLYVADKKKIEEVNLTIKEIEETFAKDLVWIYVTGSGDPFVSVGFRNFLRKFDRKKYPKLTNIHLHTNATMWDEEMWNTMKPIHRYVKTCEISIDAATKETYETKTRIGGDWDILLKNLEFINTIPNLTYIKTSFVVQSDNYKEMVPFLQLMKSIFGKKVKVFFGKVNNWGTYTDEEFNRIKVWDDTHENYLDFVDEFNKVGLDHQVFHNMQEFIKINKTFI